MKCVENKENRELIYFKKLLSFGFLRLNILKIIKQYLKKAFCYKIWSIAYLTFIFKLISSIIPL